MIFYITLLAIIAIVALNLFSGRLSRLTDSSPTHQRYSVGMHVIVSGGSKGIGKALAKKFAESGTHVTIIARNEADLAIAKIELEKCRKNSHVQQIRAVSLDLTKLTFPDDSETKLTSEQKETLENILGEHDRCDILVNCCGSSIPTRFEDISQQEFRVMMDVNYFSAVNLTRLLLPVMKARSLSNQNGSRQNGGRIVFVSSICGLLSFFGYSAYSASKFALVGLAESLNMELKPFDISVTIAFPPDTDTPGFEQENKIKPSLTSKISESGKVYKPEEVAQSIYDDIRARKFASTLGIENLLVLSATNAFMPVDSLWKLLVECIIAGPLRLIAYFILRSWYSLVNEAAHGEIIKAEMALKFSRHTKGDELLHKKS